MWFSTRSRKTKRLASTAIFVTCYVAFVEPSESSASSILGGITNVASSATNFLVNAVEKPKNIILNATRVTTDYIDSAASKGLEFKLRRVLEKFRSRMPQGIPDLRIPPLEPLKVKEAVLETRNPDIGSKEQKVRLSVEDATINRLSTFTVDRARLSLIGPMIAVNISVPTIYVDGYYNISGKVGNVFPVYGAGAFQAMVYDFRVYVNTVLGYSRGMYMKSFDLDFSLETVDMVLDNFMGGDEVGRIMTEVFQDLIPAALDIIKPEILPKIQDFIASYANETIYHLTMRDLLSILIGEGEARDLLIVP